MSANVLKSVSATILATLSSIAPVGASKCVMRSPVVDFDAVVIVDYFREPKCEQCTGNRGIEMQLKSGQPILAVADGVISFRGEVNRTNYLVLLTKSNHRITYGRIATSNLQVGDQVVAGQPIAVSSPKLYFGIREVSGITVQYFDPMKFLARPPKSYSRAVLLSDKASPIACA